MMSFRPSERTMVARGALAEAPREKCWNGGGLLPHPYPVGQVPASRLKGDSDFQPSGEPVPRAYRGSRHGIEDGFAITAMLMKDLGGVGAFQYLFPSSLYFLPPLKPSEKWKSNDKKQKGPQSAVHRCRNLKVKGGGKGLGIKVR